LVAGAGAVEDLAGGLVRLAVDEDPGHVVVSFASVRNC
jgi:hypothetical protein